MDNVTLNQINNNILLLRKEVKRIAGVVEESHLEIEEDLIGEIEESRNQNQSELVSHEDMKEEFGDDND